MFGIDAHAPELHDVEQAAVEPHALLQVQDRPTALQKDQQTGDQDHRGRHHQQYRCANDVEQAFHDRAQQPLTETITKNQPAGRYGIEPDLPQRLLEMGSHVDHPHTLQLAVEQFPQGHAAAASFGQGHHDLVDLLLDRDIGQRHVGRQDAPGRHLGHRLIGAGVITHQIHVGIGLLQRPPDQFGAGTGAEHEHALAHHRCGTGMADMHPVQQHQKQPPDHDHGDKFTIAHPQRHDMQHQIGHGQDQHQKQRAARPGLRHGTVVHPLVKPQRTIDDQGKHRQKCGRRQRRRRGNEWFTRSPDGGGNDRTNHQTEIKKQLQNGPPVNVMIEYLDHVRGLREDTVAGDRASSIEK